MKLKELLAGIPVLESTVDLEMHIDAVAYDSRKVTPGSLFVAVTGFAADGNRFIPMAMEKGAAVVVTAKHPQEAIPYVLVPSDRQALAMIGCNFLLISSISSKRMPSISNPCLVVRCTYPLP